MLRGGVILSFIKKLLGKKTTKKAVKGTQIPEEAFISRQNHKISKVNISDNALKVLNRLAGQELQAYLVGGSVRDLSLGQTPKDFDVVTEAHPQQVRKCFKNSRIIGRRFKLVHVLFYRDVIEVATFRKAASHIPEGHKKNQHGMVISDNCYGTLEDDVWRRDLTINALYYDHQNSAIIDFVGGFKDLQNKVIRMIGDPLLRYEEDPVRMLRVIRFASKLSFTIEEETHQAIREKASLLANVSSSRLFEEVSKLFHSGNAVEALRLLQQEDLFQYLFPYTTPILEQDEKVAELIRYTLESTDSRIKSGKPVTPAFIYAVFLWPYLLQEAEILNQQGLPQLVALEKAMGIILSKQSKYISIPKRFTQAMREMWLLQYKLPKRYGNRAYKSLEHPRFRAAYDFLLLRTLAGEEDPEIAQWWTDFQEADPTQQKKMIKKLTRKPTKKT